MRINGTVMWFSETKGYGFVKGDDGICYFAHFKNINESGYKTLYRGQRVNFIPATGEKGEHALKLHYQKEMQYLEDQRR